MARAASKTLMLLGQCVPCTKINASKLRVKRLVLDTNLLMYFRKDEYYYAADPEKKCKTGDIVLIQELPSKLTRLIKHQVLEIIYPLGDITDPISGKKVVVGKYREDINDVNKFYGESSERFMYENASARGWQEEKKDFTNKKTYIKYHVFENDDQPYAV